jgi:hypothetical protein
VGGGVSRNVLVISTYNFDRRPWNGVLFEFADVIGRIELTSPVAPEPATPGVNLNGSLVEAFFPADGKLRRGLHRAILMGRRGFFKTMTVEEHHDICLFMCQFPRELRNLRRVHGWRRRSRFAAAFILETWTQRLAEDAAALRMLDEFDHVFVLNAGSIPELQRYTRTPVSFLPTGVDAIGACPSETPPERVIDILSLGRHVPGAHLQMLDVARAERLFYHFDLWSGLQARDWKQVRETNAGLIQRSRFSVVWSPAEHLSHLKLQRREAVLSTRYFESMAGGAILIGSRVRAPEFDDLVGTDTVVEIAPDGSDFARVFAALHAEPEWQAEMRVRNVAASLRRHDWAHRWGEVLRVAGAEPTVEHRQRLAELGRRAAAVERIAHASPPAHGRIVEEDRHRGGALVPVRLLVPSRVEESRSLP